MYEQTVLNVRVTIHFSRFFAAAGLFWLVYALSYISSASSEDICLCMVDGCFPFVHAADKQ